jgi:hypothetical protein
MTSAEFYSVASSYIVIAVTLLGIYLAYKVNFSSTHESQLNKVYSPLFIKIEPNLYKKISLDIAKDYADFFMKVIKDHHVLCNPELVERVSNFCRKVENRTDYQDVFNEICSHVDRCYDALRRRLKLPRRSIAYRLNHNQYRNKTMLTLGFVVFCLRQLLTAAVTIMVILALMAATMNVINPMLQKLIAR